MCKKTHHYTWRIPKLRKGSGCSLNSFFLAQWLSPRTYRLVKSRLLLITRTQVIRYLQFSVYRLPFKKTRCRYQALSLSYRTPKTWFLKHSFKLRIQGHYPQLISLLCILRPKRNQTQSKQLQFIRLLLHIYRHKRKCKPIHSKSLLHFMPACFKAQCLYL